jgi:ribose-phosphate pyrophosphokinase
VSDGWKLYVNFEQSEARRPTVFLLQSPAPDLPSTFGQLRCDRRAETSGCRRQDHVASSLSTVRTAGEEGLPARAANGEADRDLLDDAVADQCVALDLHADARSRASSIFRSTHDRASYHFGLPYSQGLERQRHCRRVAGRGPCEKVRRIAGRLGCPLAVGYKTHPEHGVSDITHLAGDVNGKTCIVYDDMISSGGSINEIVRRPFRARGEAGYYRRHHARASGRQAVERLARPEIAELVITNTIPLPEEKRLAKMTQLSVAPMFSHAIRAIWSDGSVSRLFDF